MQTALAVGDTQAEGEKAEFSKLKFWVSIHKNDSTYNCNP